MVPPLVALGSIDLDGPDGGPPDCFGSRFLWQCVRGLLADCCAAPYVAPSTVPRCCAIPDVTPATLPRPVLIPLVLDAAATGQ